MIGAVCDAAQNGFWTRIRLYARIRSVVVSNSTWIFTKIQKIERLAPGLSKTSKIIKIGQVVFEKSQFAQSHFLKKCDFAVLLDKSFN